MFLPDGIWEIWVSPRGATPYPVRVGPGVASSVNDFLQDRRDQVLIVDANVARLHGKPKGARLAIEFNASEAQKSRKAKNWAENRILSNGFGRDCCVLAMGGGVTTDLAGFIAATYMRGVPWVVLPTTLLGAVDASIGGKVAVNTAWGKNTIGAFHQPRIVLIDTDLLATLPIAEIDNGLAEMVKHAALADAGYLDDLIRDADAIRERDPKAMQMAIQRSLEIKAHYVSLDSQDRNVRQYLNFGHTIGHAIEQCSEWTVPHGQAVSIGMAVEAGIAARLGVWTECECERLRDALSSIGLPRTVPNKLAAQRLLDCMKGDKKRIDSQLRFAIPPPHADLDSMQNSNLIEVPVATILNEIEICR